MVFVCAARSDDTGLTPSCTCHCFRVIHPLVLLSVVDHASRVPTSSRKRILGILLGQDDGKVINVANSWVLPGRPVYCTLKANHEDIDRFAVPFEEDERDPKTWFLDLDYIESMWEMFKKVNGELPGLSLSDRDGNLNEYRIFYSQGATDWILPHGPSASFKRFGNL